MRECVNQMLLYVAMRAWHAIANRTASEDPIRNPLPPVHDVVKAKTQSLCEELRSSPNRKEGLLTLVNHVCSSVGNVKNAAVIQQSAPWKIGDLVNWWIVAGQAVARSRSAFGAASADAPERRGAWVLDAVVGKLFLEDDEEWPPLWLAERADCWRLLEQSGHGMPATWEEPGVSASDYRHHLLDWCGHPDREAALTVGSMDEAKAKAWMRDHQTRYRDFARASLRLLREGCRYGSLRDAATVHGAWMACRCPGLPEGVFDVLRRPLHRRAAAADEAPVARGWIVVPPPSVLIAQFRHALGERAAADSPLARLIDRAADGWDGQATTFGSLRPEHPPNASADTASSVDPARRLAALAALATALELAVMPEVGSEQRTEQIPATASERLRLALALERITIRRDPALLDDRSRVIPIDKSLAGSIGGTPVKLQLGLASPDAVIDLGTLAITACCPDILFTAIEELDWRQWALQAHDAAPAKALAAADWETIKRRLLGLNVPDSGMLDLAADTFDTLHTVRLGLDRGHAGDEATAWLVDSLCGMERALCRLLTDGQSTDVPRLHPPRTADAEVCLDAWLDAPRADDPRDALWDVAWERSSSPFGRAIREELRTGDRFGVVFSAGEAATDADLRLLAAPGVVRRPAGPWSTIAAPIVAVIRTAIPTDTGPDLTATIRGVREALAGAAATAFDDLVRRATGKDAIATDWIRMMREDARFGFVCHPAVDAGEDGVTVRPASASDVFLEWRDDDAASDREIGIRFATDPARARRVFSRGRPETASAEAAAARLEAIVRDGPAVVAAAAGTLRFATDRRRMFGEAAPDAVVAALATADALAVAGGEQDTAAAAFHELSAWCRASGCRLAPDQWHPNEGIAADGLEVPRVGFHATVPPGRVVVERFGARRADGTSVATWEGFKSAGPAPEGFAAVEHLAGALTGEGAEILTFQRAVTKFASRSLEGHGSLAAANLFDVAWKAVLSRPDDAQLREAVAAVQTLLQKSYKLIAFSPKSLGEYPEDWLHDPHDRPARGQRVERVVRPGLKKIDNVLVFPAKVETG